MSIWYGLDRIPPELNGSVVTIGVFDGVHRGHQQLIARAVAAARKRGIPSVLFTFDPHPTVVFKPDAVPPLLGTVRQRAELAQNLGIDHVVVVAFTPEIASWSPAEYVERALVQRLGARHVIVGENFTFGHKAAGTPETLETLGAEKGFTVDTVPLLSEGTGSEEHIICSTWIREQLQRGNITAVNQGLGRKFSVRGEVTHGAGRGGRALGFPTANLYFPETYALPADGVYAGYLKIPAGQAELAQSGITDTVGTMPVGKLLPAAISVGTNPTFGHEPRSVEAFVLDYEADLYGLQAEVSFVHWLRGMETYHSLDELIAAIRKDVSDTREHTQPPR